MEAEELLSKVSKGQELSPEQIQDVVDVLSNWYEEKPRENNINELYAYLILIKKSKLKQHHKLVATFLREKDALIVSLVIEILCLEWSYTEEYLPHIISIALGLSWDLDSDAREQAMKVLGEYQNQQSKKDSKILELLFNALEDKDNDMFLRKTAYNSISRAMEIEWESLPADCKLIDFDSKSLAKDHPEIDLEVLKKAKSLV